MIPSSSVQAGFAAIGRIVADGSADENERAMLEELEQRATGEITVASRDASSTASRSARAPTSGSSTTRRSSRAATSTGRRSTRSSTACSPAARSFLTILSGEEHRRSTGSSAELAHAPPDLEVEIHEGGQPHYPLLVVAQ